MAPLPANDSPYTYSTVTGVPRPKFPVTTLPQHGPYWYATEPPIPHPLNPLPPLPKLTLFKQPGAGADGKKKMIVVAVVLAVLLVAVLVAAWFAWAKWKKIKAAKERARKRVWWRREWP